MPHITYSYDPLGRLKAVIGEAGDIAMYEYDSVGNLLSVERSSSSILSISEISPASASVGAPITIHGTGFSVTASQNAVTFAGIPSAVTEATATRIATSVPSGAATGPITVATPTGLATSSTDFTIVAAPEAPTVTGLSPTIGIEGTSVAIRGTGFDASPAGSKVTFNGTLAIVTSASASLIEAVVPPGIGSGPVALRTQSGVSAGDGDFFIPPAPRTAADVEFTGRVALGDSAAVTISTPNMIALVVCDALAGHSLNIGVSEVTIANLGIFELSVLSPHEAILARKLMAGQLIDDMAVNSVPETGTYTVVIDPGATPVSLTLALSEPVTGTLTVDGPPVLISLDRPGQRGQLTFDGSTGQRVSLSVSDVHIGAGSDPLSGIKVAILDPDGTLLASKITASDTAINPEPLPKTGNYAIAIDPDRTKTVSMTLTLSEQ
jgi:IPT/TIG domain